MKRSRSILNYRNSGLPVASDWREIVYPAILIGLLVLLLLDLAGFIH